jgi:DNA-binding MarR family transcriptional regulator
MSSNSGKSDKNEASHRKALMDHMQFLGQMASTETALFHQKAAATFGLGITDMKALSTLMQEGPKTAGQIAERLSLTTGAVTNLIDRLEQRGLVQRQMHESDRRKVVVAVNSKNLQNAENIYESIGQTFEKLLRTYSTEQLEFLVEYYKTSIELTKQEIARLTKGKRQP